MQIIHTLQQTVHSLSIPYILSTGVLTLAGFYVGKSMKFIRLPSVIGFMLVGVIMGPSVIGLLDEAAQVHLSFVTEICLGFVALSIGLELHLKSLKRQGMGIILIILSESFLAFILVTFGLYFLTGNFPLSLLFGAIAPASAPAGTVAIIQEYKAKGSLTQALYAVVGFDDGLGIIIFGFAAAFAKNMLLKVNGEVQSGFFDLIAAPLKEIGLSILFGFIIAYVFRLLIRKTKSSRDTFIMTFAIVLVTTGISLYLHLSLEDGRRRRRSG